MILSDQLWREAKNLKQEILDLKQVKKASAVSKYFIYQVPQGQTYFNIWRITYKDGLQPIITEVMSGATTSLSAPENNIQYIFAYAQYNAALTILSTREIENVEGIPT